MANVNPVPTEQTQAPVMTMDQVMQMIQALRAPSEEEVAKKEIEKQKKKEFAAQALQEAEDTQRNKFNFQRACAHKNPKNHTFVANIAGNGSVRAHCGICKKDWAWQATPEQLAQGVNLFEMKDITEVNLRNMEKMYPAKGEKPDRVKWATRSGIPEDKAWEL